jgi:hypothetical protein
MSDFLDAIVNLDVDAEIAENNAAVAAFEGRAQDAVRDSKRATSLRKAQLVLEDLQATK